MKKILLILFIVLLSGCVRKQPEHQETTIVTKDYDYHCEVKSDGIETIEYDVEKYFERDQMIRLNLTNGDFVYIISGILECSQYLDEK